jgi:hypothetical protein
MAARLEILKISDNHDGWRQAHLALDGKLACPLDISEERYRSFKHEAEWLKYLESQAAIAIRVFGDFRNIRRREDGEYIRVDPDEGG